MKHVDALSRAKMMSVHLFSQCYLASLEKKNPDVNARITEMGVGLLSLIIILLSVHLRSTNML